MSYNLRPILRIATVGAIAGSLGLLPSPIRTSASCRSGTFGGPVRDGRAGVRPYDGSVMRAQRFSSIRVTGAVSTEPEKSRVPALKTRAPA